MFIFKLIFLFIRSVYNRNGRKHGVNINFKSAEFYQLRIFGGQRINNVDTHPLFLIQEFLLHCSIMNHDALLLRAKYFTLYHIVFDADWCILFELKFLLSEETTNLPHHSFDVYVRPFPPGGIVGFSYKTCILNIFQCRSWLWFYFNNNYLQNSLDKKAVNQDCSSV